MISIHVVIKKFNFNYKSYNINTKYGEKIDSKIKPKHFLKDKGPKIIESFFFSIFSIQTNLSFDTIHRGKKIY